MLTCAVDSSIKRVTVDGFAFPLGVYPLESMSPKPGFTVEFEPADSDDEEWEHWPDRYVYDITMSATRIPAFVKMLLSLAPARVYPILDVLGTDAFREVDPYLAYQLVGIEHVVDGLRRFESFLLEDGLVGFGVMSEEPFLYLFVDEHKIVTLRVPGEQREQVEAILGAFDLKAVEELASVDSSTHEHTGILIAPDDRMDLLNAEEIVEYLRTRWLLTLNVDPETNVDDEGKELGFTAWRVIVRCRREDDGPALYAEVFAIADCLEDAEVEALEATPSDHADAPDAKSKSKGSRGGSSKGQRRRHTSAEDPQWAEHEIVHADRILPTDLAQALKEPNLAKAVESARERRLVRMRWLDS